MRIVRLVAQVKGCNSTAEASYPQADFRTHNDPFNVILADESMIKRLLLSYLVILACSSAALAAPEDGAYDAVVTTSSGAYNVEVEVEGGEVSHIYWPNGGAMSVHGAYLGGGFAVGTNSRGDTISIEIDDGNYDPDEED